MINNPAFVVNTYESYDELEECLSSFREVYKDNKIVIIVDGDEVNYNKLVEEYKTDILRGRRWKIKYYGGMWTERYLEYMITKYKENDWYIKIDPDTVVNRKIEAGVPDNYQIFSTVPERPRNVGLYGGVIGYSREVAKKIVESKMLLNPIYTRCAYTITWRGEKVSFQDLILTKVLSALKIEVYNHPEVASNWKIPPENSSEYAIYHPRRKK